MDRSGTIDVNTFLSMNIIKIEMEACENIWSGRKCKKVKKGGKCTYKNKWNKCLKTCGCSCGSCYGADTPIGKSNFYFKISPLDGSCLFCIFFQPRGASIKGTSWAINANKSKFCRKRHLLASLYIKLNFCFFSLQKE